MKGLKQLLSTLVPLVLLLAFAFGTNSSATDSLVAGSAGISGSGDQSLRIFEDPLLTATVMSTLGGDYQSLSVQPGDDALCTVTIGDCTATATCKWTCPKSCKVTCGVTCKGTCAETNIDCYPKATCGWTVNVPTDGGVAVN